MNWIKLTKKALESLKVIDQKTLVIDTKKPGSDIHEYDIIEYLDLSESYDVDDKEFNFHWANLLNRQDKYEYDDGEVLHGFTHYIILKRPDNIQFKNELNSAKRHGKSEA